MIAKTILKNSISNWVGMVVNAVVIFILTPYLIRKLGNERFGIYQIIAPVIGYLMILELGMRGAVTRFATGYINARDIESLNKVITTVFYMCAVLGIIVLIICSWLGVFATHFFAISVEYKWQTLILFVGLGLSAVVSFLGYGFSAILIGHNRYDLQNFCTVIGNIGRAIFAFIIFSLGWISLSSWSLAIVSASLLSLAAFALFGRKLEDNLRIKWEFLNAGTFKQLSGFGIWNLFQQLSGVIMMSANPVIIGKCIGVDSVPYYAIPYLVVTQLQSFIVGITSTLIPHASAAMVNHDIEQAQKLLIRGTYLSAAILFPIGGALIIMFKNLLGLWISPEFESSWVILAILMIGLFGAITQTTSYYILLGGGCIRAMSITNFVAAVFSVILSIFLICYWKLGIVGAAISLAVTQLISACMLQPIYACRQFNLKFLKYMTDSYFVPFLCALPSVLLGIIIVHYFPPKNLLIWAFEFTATLLPFIYFTIFGPLDLPIKNLFLSTFKSKLEG